MQVVHWGRARQFFQKYPAAEIPLKQWRRAVQEAEWRDYPDVKRTFNTADWYKGKIIFDIKGNDYRLIAVGNFVSGRLYISDVLTHEEYEKGDWKE